MSIITGTEGGSHVVATPLTTSLANNASPDLLLSEIDSRITKIAPSATPVDQISRYAAARKAGSMIVEYYSVDSKPAQAKLQVTINSSTASYVSGDTKIYTIYTDNDAIFEPSETILVPEQSGFGDDNRADNTPLMLYVVGKGEESGIRVTPVNGQKNPGSNIRTLSVIDKDTVLVRMGRAAAELDVQTAQFNALPKKASNYCQIFKAQVEESTLQKIANKEVGWDFSDQEEVAIMDMRRGMERNYIFGAKARIYDPLKQEEILFTGGIWQQAGKDFKYTDSTDQSEFIAHLASAAFTGNGSSNRKVLIAGSELIDFISKFDFTRSVGAGEAVTYWGVDFHEIHSKYGTLLVVHSEIFDECQMPGHGIVIDPQYLTKYSHIPFRTERLDLKKSGQRNTDAVVITEASCLVLRNPAAHVRVIKEEEE